MKRLSVKRLLTGLTAGAALTLFAGLTLATGATGTSETAAGILQLQARFQNKWDPVSCPSGTLPSMHCARFVGNGVVPGLGHAAVTYTIVDDEVDSACHLLGFTTVVIEVAGKGAIDVSLTDPARQCWKSPPSRYGPFAATVISGSGRYAEASGSASIQMFISLTATTSASVDDWTGTLTVPGLNFDATPPGFRGAASKTVRAPKGAKRVRVRYRVTAQDTIDGSVPVSCYPKSGSRFRLGRTRVACSAEDKSGNIAKAKFTVTVKRA